MLRGGVREFGNDVNRPAFLERKLMAVGVNGY